MFLDFISAINYRCCPNVPSLSTVCIHIHVIFLVCVNPVQVFYVYKCGFFVHASNLLGKDSVLDMAGVPDTKCKDMIFKKLSS